MLKILRVNTSELCNEREEYLSRFHHKKRLHHSKQMSLVCEQLV